MNWIERRYRRDMLIADKRDGLRAELIEIVKKSVEFYNNTYCGKPPADCTANHSGVTLTKPYSPSNQPLRTSQVISQARIDLSFDQSGVHVVRTFPRSNADSATKKSDFGLDTDEDGQVLFKCKDRRYSPDEVAQEILEDWLFPAA